MQSIPSLKALAEKLEEAARTGQSGELGSQLAAQLGQLANPFNCSGGQPVSSHLVTIPSFGTNPGALQAHLHVPTVLPPKAPALVVALHGCGQNAAVYDHGTGWSVLAERHGFYVLFPEQQPQNNAKRCFNWFEPGDTARGRGEAFSVRQMIEHVTTAYGLDRDQVFVTGLSAGGAMTSVMLAAYPEVFAAGAVIAGLPYGAAVSVNEAFQAMFHDRPMEPAALGARVKAASRHSGPFPRVSVWHGAADRVVVPSNAEHSVAQWLEVHGLSRTAPVESRLGPHRLRQWKLADGTVMVEAVTLEAMAHGVPLAPGQGPDACGNVGPFFLDAGICSTRAIAASWGLSREVVNPEAMHPRPATAGVPPGGVGDGSAAGMVEAALKSAGLGDAAKSPAVAGALSAIDKALRAAGLKGG